MAFFDGELSPEEQAEVEQSLASSPELQADLEAWSQLQQLCDEVAIEEPSQVKWEASLSEVRKKITGSSSTSQPRQPASFPWLLALAGVAAAAVVMVGVGVLFWNPAGAPENSGEKPQAVPVIAEEEDEFFGEEMVIAGATDVEIISMEDYDVDALVIGEPPLSEPMLLAGPGDITIHETIWDSNQPGSPGFHASEKDAPIIVVGLDDRAGK